jgi:hypothetical protein
MVRAVMAGDACVAPTRRWDGVRAGGEAGGPYPPLSAQV